MHLCWSSLPGKGVDTVHAYSLFVILAETWVFLTSNLTRNCVRCAYVGCLRSASWAGHAFVGWLLSDRVVRREKDLVWLFCV